MASFSGGANYSGVSIGDQANNQYIGRVDHKFNDKNSIFIHYIYGYRGFPFTDTNPNFRYTGTYPMYNAALQYIHVFSPALVNEARAGVNLEHVKQLSIRTGTGFTIESLGINGFLVGGPNGRPLTPNEEGFPLLSISGFLGIGDSRAASNLDYSRTFMFADNVTWTKGKHTLLFGADIRKVAGNATTNNTPFGQQSFTGDMTGYAPADYMLGIPRTSVTPEGVPISSIRQWRTAEYAQDNWRLNDRLTLNLGVRYEIYGVPVDLNNVSRTLDFNQNPIQLVPAPGQRLNDVWSITYKDIAPRLGFAWSFHPTTIVRGGYGITYYGGQFDNLNIMQLNPPTAGSLTITNPLCSTTVNCTTPPVATIQTPVPASLYPNPPFFNVVTMPADRRRPDLQVQTWNLTVEQQFGARRAGQLLCRHERREPGHQHPVLQLATTRRSWGGAAAASVFQLRPHSRPRLHRRLQLQRPAGTSGVARQPTLQHHRLLRLVAYVRQPGQLHQRWRMYLLERPRPARVGLRNQRPASQLSPRLRLSPA